MPTLNFRKLIPGGYSGAGPNAGNSAAPRRNDGLHGTERRAMGAFDDMLGIRTWRRSAALRRMHVLVRTWRNAKSGMTW